ncbi:MAG: twin-arginine translocase TatA/TatE family subunit [Flavobacteriales bacterium]|nr:twin-arginine translocase TatA/TatE family subunit [Flavobacteriales bacterium]
MTLLFIGGSEIFIIGLIVVMLFGADKIPELARSLGKGMRQLKDATEDIKREIKDGAIDEDVVGDIKKEISDVKKNVNDFSRPIKKQAKKQFNDNVPDLDSILDAKEDVDSIKKSVDKVTGAIKRKR